MNEPQHFVVLAKYDLARNSRSFAHARIRLQVLACLGFSEACTFIVNCSLLRVGGGGGYYGCAAGWGRIFMTLLTTMGLSFQTFSIELLGWGRTFLGL